MSRVLRRFFVLILNFQFSILNLRARAVRPAAALVVFFLLFLLVKAGEIAVGEDIVLYAGISVDGVLIQAQGFLALAVHCYDFKGAGGSDGLHIGGKHLIGGVGELSVQDIGLEEVVGAVLGLKWDIA